MAAMSPASAAIVDYLRETSPFYIYSNPITPAEAAAALVAVDAVDSPEGSAQLLAHLRAMTARFRRAWPRLGFETLRRRASDGAADGARQRRARRRW